MAAQNSTMAILHANPLQDPAGSKALSRLRRRRVKHGNRAPGARTVGSRVAARARRPTGDVPAGQLAYDHAPRTADGYGGGRRVVEHSTSLMPRRNRPPSPAEMPTPCVGI